MNTVRIYAAGGAAINIVKKFHQPNGNNKKTPGFAVISPTYIDTSRSNLPADAENETYLVQSTGEHTIDGSGKVRSANYQAVTAAIPEILHRFKPEILNIVVHSTGGGSGSVIGPTLVSELLANDQTVIVIMIGSTTCEQEIRNSINSVLSYQGICSKRNKAIISMYMENSRDRPFGQIDAAVQINILTLAAAWSGDNHGLDKQDLINFLNYDRVSKFQPNLTGLNIFTNNQPVQIEKGQAISSALTLIGPGEDPHPGLPVSYHSFGQLSEAARESMQDAQTPLHFHTVQGYFPSIVSRLEKQLKEAEEMYRVNAVQSLSLQNVKLQDDGMVL